jgi:hypothetical protein
MYRHRAQQLTLAADRMWSRRSAASQQWLTDLCRLHLSSNAVAAYCRGVAPDPGRPQQRHVATVKRAGVFVCDHLRARRPLVRAGAQ